jgi:hypothetical protein
MLHFSNIDLHEETSLGFESMVEGGSHVMKRICREWSSNNNPLHQHLLTVSKVFEVFKQYWSSNMGTSSRSSTRNELQNSSSASLEWKMGRRMKSG